MILVGSWSQVPGIEVSATKYLEKPHVLGTSCRHLTSLQRYHNPCPRRCVRMSKEQLNNGIELSLGEGSNRMSSDQLGVPATCYLRIDKFDEGAKLGEEE
jgi:hypothetical protein